MITVQNGMKAESNAVDSELDAWMKIYFRYPIIQKLPPRYLQDILLNLEEVTFPLDTIIINQGEAGDYYYVIKQGRCLATRQAFADAKEIKIRELTVGECFGEDALISGEPRDMKITALTDCSLLRLNKERFLALLKTPSIKFVDYTTMQNRRTTGAILLDVRTPEKFQQYHLNGCVNEPFFTLRMQLNKLEHHTSYIIICDDGNISAAAAYILCNHGINAEVLNGGINAVIK